MHTAYITHPACLRHNMGSHHPEAPQRLQAIQDRLIVDRLWDLLQHHEAPAATPADLCRVHDEAYVEAVFAAAPQTGMAHLDPDTAMNSHTLEAALHAAGAAMLGVDLVMSHEVENAFCAVRPPGHHAERNRAMGFCFFDNVAVGVAYALERYGFERVAIVDFDVHHGNGTEDIFRDDPRVLLCSTFQHPFYPYSGADTVSSHIVNVPLAAYSTGDAYREAFAAHVLPALDAFQPQIVFVSAGFDAHYDDDLAMLRLHTADFTWISERIKSVAARHAENRIVSCLEGGYNLDALGLCVAQHVKVLLA